MRASIVAVGGAVLFAAGIWIGWSAGGAEKHASAPTAEVAPAPRADPVTPAAVAAKEPVDSPPRARPLPVVDVPSGEISGSVRTESGEPLAGVEVIVQPRYPYERQRADAESAGEGADLAARTDAEARRLAWEDGARRTATTDAAGAFRCDGIPDVLLVVTPRRAGWRFQRSTPSYWGSPEVRIGQRADFTGVPAVEARVEVRLPDGSSPPEAWVRSSQGGRSATATWTPEKPLVSLPAGDSEVFVDAGPWAAFRSDTRQLRFQPGSPEQVLRFDLRSTPSLHGHLSFPGRQGPARASVFLLRAPAAGDVTPSMVRMQGQEWQAVDRNRWEFIYRDLAPGRHILAVFTDPNGEGPSLHMEEVAVGESLTEREVAVPLPDRSRILVVRVLGPDGQPVRSARVQVTYLEDGRMRAGCYEPSLAEDGSFLACMTRSMDRAFDPSAASFDVTKGSFRVSATADAWGGVGGEVRASSASEIVLRFAEPGSLSAAVEGYAGSPWHGRLRATLGSLPGTTVPVSLSANQSTLSAEGRAVFAAVQPGEYELTLNLGGGRSGFVNVARVPVSVGRGRSEIRTVFPPLHSVRFTGVEGRVGLKRTDDPRWFANMNLPEPGGVLFLDGLPAGEYQVDERSGKPRRFTLPGTEEVKLGR